MTTASVHNATRYWRDLDTRHHLHPFTDYKGLAAEGGSRIITHAEGVWLTDSEGNRILDGMSGLWCVNVGYGRRELAEAAYEQMLELPYYNTFFKTATPPPIELARKLAELTPEGLDHVFYASSGSEANDSIARLVRHYYKVLGKPEKRIIISRVNGYHGSTMAAASMGGMAFMHAIDDIPLPGFVHIRQPHWFDEGGDLSPEDFGLAVARDLESKIAELGADRVAAFIGEPIQGAGGVIVPPDSYWPEIQRICRTHDILLIADEVICGFGRTGHWFGSDLYGIRPDIMTLAKGITSGYVPLSAVMVGERVGAVMINEGAEFAHGFTYSGHPVACAVALANIEILEQEGLIERVRNDTGPYLQARLREFGDHPLVGECRGVGMIGALELVEDKATRRRFEPLGRAGTICRDHCVANGVVSRAVRDTMVLAPPLIITRAEIDEMLVRLRRCLDLTARELGRM